MFIFQNLQNLRRVDDEQFNIPPQVLERWNTCHGCHGGPPRWIDPRAEACLEGRAVPADGRADAGAPAARAGVECMGAGI